MERNYYKRRFSTYLTSLFVLALASSCTIYQNVPNDDGIYSTKKREKRVIVENRDTYKEQEENYFTKELERLDLDHLADSDIITDIDNYSSFNDSIPDNLDYNTDTSWGDDDFDDIVIDNLNNYGYGWGRWNYWNPYFNYGFIDPWYGPQWGWSNNWRSNRWGWNNWGWNNWRWNPWGNRYNNRFYGGRYAYHRNSHYGKRASYSSNRRYSNSTTRRNTSTSSRRSSSVYRNNNSRRTNSTRNYNSNTRRSSSATKRRNTSTRRNSNTRSSTRDRNTNTRRSSTRGKPSSSRSSTRSRSRSTPSRSSSSRSKSSSSSSKKRRG